MITLRWTPLEGADITTYKIYRAMIGVKTPLEAPFGLISGDSLQIKLNNDTLQTITFDDDYDIEELVTVINNQITGGTAYQSKIDDSLILRSNIRSEPGYLVIVGGTALSKMGLTTGPISENSNMVHIGSVSFGTNEFEDLNGVLEDYYSLSTVSSLGDESNLSNPRQAINFTGPICVVEGCITDLQGRRVCDVQVTARIVNPPESVQDHSFITKETMTTLTGEDGRFSLPLLQCARVIFEIDDVRVSDPISIPAQPYVFFDELPIDYNYKFQDKL
jgi:hypothetical protein